MIAAVWDEVARGLLHEAACPACQRLLPRIDYARERARRDAAGRGLDARLLDLDARERFGREVEVAIEGATAPRGLHRLMAIEDVRRFRDECPEEA